MALLALALLLSSGALAASPQAGGGGRAVVAYLPEWRYEGANWEAISEHVTHLLLFSLEPDAKGSIVAWDRFPRPELLRLAREATRRHGTKLLVCFGGNGRSAGFSSMVRSSKRRKRFLTELEKLLSDYDLDGVDYNWEYPGYVFGRGYQAEEEINKDYKGLSRLIRETRAMFAAAGVPDRVVTMAYYPDGRQERLLKDYGISEQADLMHMMSYDQGGAQHSSLEFGQKAVDQGRRVLPAEKLTMGLPFYGRHSRTGDWTTYEDLVQRHDPLDPEADSVPAPDGGASIGFNGAATIATKTRYAADKGLAGVMIWEVGQDCRLAPVRHGDGPTHVRTCPSNASSLLKAIAGAYAAADAERGAADEL